MAFSFDGERGRAGEFSGAPDDGAFPFAVIETVLAGGARLFEPGEGIGATFTAGGGSGGATRRLLEGDSPMRAGWWESGCSALPE